MIFAIKMLGIFAVLLSVVAIMYIKIKEKKKSLYFIEDFISCLKYIEDLIAVDALVLGEVLAKAKEVAKQSKPFFENVEAKLKKEDNPTLMCAWQECTQMLKSEGFLKAETLDVIERIGSHLGKMSISIETDNLMSARTELKNIKEKTKEECARDCRLIKSLGMALCGFIILIFI